MGEKESHADCVIYNVPQSSHFDGDIVITDPYYFLNRAKVDDVIEEPRWEDFFPRPQYTEEMLADEKIKKEFEECNERMNAAYIRWCENNIDDSDLIESFDNLEALGFTNFLLAKTGYGPWTCSVYEQVSNNLIGTFTADAGLVGVFLLDEVCRYNPKYRKNTMPWTATRILGFHGNISITNKSKETGIASDISVIGTGNVDFYSKQTGM